MGTVEDNKSKLMQEILKCDKLSNTAVLDGTTVVVVGLDDPLVPFTVGKGHECACTVCTYDNKVAVIVPNGHHGRLRYTVPREYLVEYQYFITYMNKLLLIKDFKGLKPKFTLDMVLYVIPNHSKPSHVNPQIGSEFETDLKVIEVKPSMFETSFYYRCYNPLANQFVHIPEENLIIARDRERYVNADFQEATVEIDSLPFFELGEKVKVFSNNVHNLDNSVIVPLTQELKDNLKFI